MALKLLKTRKMRQIGSYIHFTRFLGFWTKIRSFGAVVKNLVLAGTYETFFFVKKIAIISWGLGLEVYSWALEIMVVISSMIISS